jgi:predicted RNA methylase
MRQGDEYPAAHRVANQLFEAEARRRRIKRDSLEWKDLFSGCGGLSLGFQAAGCDIVAAMEIDALAAQSHAINFHRGASQSVQRRAL